MTKTESVETIAENIKEMEQTLNEDVNKILSTLQANKTKINQNKNLYYNEAQDKEDIKQYYESISKPSFSAYHKLVKQTHKNKIPYYISKDHYLYTWVDLYPDGSMKSIYSGEQKNPKAVILEDFERIQKRYDEFQQLLEKQNPHEAAKEKLEIEANLKFNTEHIVPQSWYSSREPMKGDLHHLFVCQPYCNAIRSNFPYGDFSFYVPESPYEPIQNRCGVASEGLFEPEYGKGAVARAMLYFLLRYPKAIKRSYRKKIDLDLLLYWNRVFDVSIYEKHRNQAIFQIQGNRNPFIDFPELGDRISLPL